MADDQQNSRFLPCYLLLLSNIHCVVWCEDAIAHYGAPTVVFELYVLVPNIDEAAKILLQKGWTFELNAQAKFGNASLGGAHRCLIPPSIESSRNNTCVHGIGPPPLPSKELPRPTATILLPATEWNFVFPGSNQHSSYEFQISFFPPLPELLDALTDKLLDDPLTDSMFWGHLATLIAYLYGYVPALREKSFSKMLKHDHQQFHLDWLSGMSTGTLPFIHHERIIRDSLRKGEYQLRDCSAGRDDKGLFRGEIEARIMDSRPSPFSPEDYERSKREFWESEINDGEVAQDDVVRNLEAG